jgi:hypothetical protein
VKQKKKKKKKTHDVNLGVLKLFLPLMSVMITVHRKEYMIPIQDFKTSGTLKSNTTAEKRHVLLWDGSVKWSEAGYD